MEKSAYTIEEAIAASGIGRTKLYTIINEGRLKARKCGKRTLILKEDFQAFLNDLEPYTPEKPNAA